MAKTRPTISLWLEGEQSFQLGQKGTAGTPPVIKVHMHDTSSAATLVIPGFQPSTRSFSLQLALQYGVFELFDAESHAKITVPQIDIRTEELVVRAGAPVRLFDLKLDPRDKFWTQLLTPGHRYKIGWVQGDKAPWAYRGDFHQDAPERLLVRLGKEPITYTVIDNTTTPLLFSVSINPTDKICHLTGEPRFGFKLSITSHQDDITTVCLDKTPLKELHGLEEIVRVENERGQQVEWDWGIGCWESEGPEPFPSDTTFEEFKPGVPYERTFWLTKTDENNDGGDLTDLEAGKRYTGEVSKTLLRSFVRNQKGKKCELLAGSEQEKKERWARVSQLVFVDVSDPFTFETV